MKKKELFEIAGYFANPIRNARIEIEARVKTINAYIPTYNRITGAPFPINTDSVYELPNNADKWGREMRLYFNCTNAASVPVLVGQLMTVGGRPGYDNWNQRLNSRDIIDELFTVGFRLGNPQNLAEIQTFIPPAYLNYFNIGFNAL
ncbi:MAG: hypothetical protein JNK09_01520 [Prolixibacteraceae bacterium]|nr:hypothetical protein [Prolixibacteraceae bacterium]